MHSLHMYITSDVLWIPKDGFLESKLILGFAFPFAQFLQHLTIFFNDLKGLFSALHLQKSSNMPKNLAMSNKVEPCSSSMVYISYQKKNLIQKIRGSCLLD